MSQTLAHRARYGFELWQAGPIGLSAALGGVASLPQVAQDNPARFVVAADALLDHDANELASMGVSTSKTLTDADLIGAAYQQWGSACVQKLRGNFAFALWDAEKHTLFCARDPLG